MEVALLLSSSIPLLAERIHPASCVVSSSTHVHVFHHLLFHITSTHAFPSPVEAVRAVQTGPFALAQPSVFAHTKDRVGGRSGWQRYLLGERVCRVYSFS
jgi:hypothetical protein